MTHDEKVTEARALRNRGLILRDIAAQLGVSITTIVRWTNPDYAQAELAACRAWKAAHRDHTRAYNAAYNATHKGTCTRCGGEIVRKHDGGVCLPCRSRARHERALWIQRQWAAGKSLREIRDELGWTEGRLANEIHRLRAEGYDLPYRYNVGSDGKRVKAAA